MDTSMVERVQDKHWYLAVGDRSIGPLTTALVMRGIESGKVPLTAWICQVGANAWSALSSFGEFQDVVDRVLSSEIPANQQSPVGLAQPGRAAIGESSPSSATRDHGQVAHFEVAAASVADTHVEPRQGLELAQTPEQDQDQQVPEPAPLLAYEIDDQALPSFAHDVEDAELVTSVALPYDSGAQVITSHVAEPTHDLASQIVGRGELPSVDEHSGPREVPPELRPAWLSEPTAHADGVDASAPSEGPMDFGAAALAAPTGHELHDDLGIDITFEEDEENAVDWSERFQSYFLVGTEVELPEETKLLQSLHETPRATFLHDEALWNLSLCLAFGSDEVAATSARTFFDAIAYDQASERIEWICRTLLSKGFMPSGIPRVEGKRGIDYLRQTCPIDLLDVLDREAMD